MRERQVWNRVGEFAAHMSVGAVLFLVIAFSAVSLRWMTEYLESVDYPSLITQFLTVAEKGILGVDVVLVVVFVIRSVSVLIRHKSSDGGADE